MGQSLYTLCTRFIQLPPPCLSEGLKTRNKHAFSCSLTNNVFTRAERERSGATYTVNTCDAVTSTHSVPPASSDNNTAVDFSVTRGQPNVGWSSKTGLRLEYVCGMPTMKEYCQLVLCEHDGFRDNHQQGFILSAYAEYEPSTNFAIFTPHKKVLHKLQHRTIPSQQ